MFEDRSNLIGLALLIGCGLSAGIMLGYIETGTVPVWDGPAWIKWSVVGAGVALILYGLIQSMRGRWFGHDLPGPRRRWFPWFPWWGGK